MLPDITPVQKVKILGAVNEYERYLPTAYDDTLSLLEKINKIINHLNQLSLVTGDLVDNWNKLYEWIINEGLKQTVKDQLENWLKDGTLSKIIEEILFTNRVFVLDIHLSSSYTDKTEVTPFNFKFKSLKNAVLYIKNMTKIPFVVNIISDDEEYVWDEQIIFENEDYSFINIKGNFKINVVGFKECYAIPSSPNNYEFIPALYGKMSKLPTLTGKFRQILVTDNDPVYDPDKCQMCQVKGDIFGFVLLDNSSITFKTNMCSIENFNDFGIVGANGSQITAHGINITQIGNIKDLTPENADTLGKGNGVLLIESGFAGNKSNITYCGLAGINCSQSSSADVDGSNISECGHHNILTTSCSTLSFKGGTANNCMDDSLVAYADSHIDARDSVVLGKSNSKNYGIIATRTSTINFAKGTTTGCEYGVMANRGSVIDCTGCIIETRSSSTTTKADAVRSANGSTLIITDANVTHKGYGDVATAENGATLVCNNTTLNGGSTAKTGVMAYAGTVKGVNCRVTGGTASTLLATKGGSLTMVDSSITGINVNGVECVHAYGGDINVNDSTIQNAWRPFVATQGGRISAYGTTISGFSDKVALSYGGDIILKNAVVNMSSTGGTAQATQGGTMNVTGTKFYGSSRMLLEVFFGGMISATQSLLNDAKMSQVNLSKPPNVFAENGDGVILYNKLSV